MRSCETTGKNIEQAIANALLELKVAREDVDIKILSEGGFLKKAKVRVTISEDALEKYEKRQEIKKYEKRQEIKKEVEADDENFAENFVKQKIAQTEEKPQEKPQEKKITIIADEEYEAPKPKKEKQKRMSPEDFLSGVLKTLNLNGEFDKTEDEKYVFYNLRGEGVGDLIGYHGECMLALSYLMTVLCEAEDHKRIVLDIENYREKRKESLAATAKRVADKVAKTGRYHKFEPMDASERKAIHTALQDDDRVTTLSKGVEPKRYLIVFPKEYRE